MFFRLLPFGVRNNAKRLSVRTDQILALLRFKQNYCEYCNDCRNQESPFEIIRITRLTEVAANQRGKERTHIYTHIEYSISRVQTSVSRFIKLSDQ